MQFRVIDGVVRDFDYIRDAVGEVAGEAIGHYQCKVADAGRDRGAVPH